ncbi:hypothetical protein LshimejAT787_0410290 [Lyophyllum shimeji]|uniref:Secreted protein n=1 Tax=Lyophyllum shimeji TaxID=47721 RepID=A0A9P3PL82_LYOSH|nr:hypothetical protein LshimejAT787_0410290 [Lyophyllum shimeji]
MLRVLKIIPALVVFYFTPGLGACGFTNTSTQTVASVSSTFFNTFLSVHFLNLRAWARLISPQGRHREPRQESALHQEMIHIMFVLLSRHSPVPVSTGFIFDLAAGMKNITASVVDYFVADAPFNVGLSPTAFQHFASLDDGVAPNVT